MDEKVLTNIPCVVWITQWFTELYLVKPYAKRPMRKKFTFLKGPEKSLKCYLSLKLEEIVACIKC